MNEQEPEELDPLKPEDSPEVESPLSGNPQA